MSDRSGYAAHQADLLDALMRGDGYPAGFGAAQGDAAGRSLRAKRARAVRHAWPALATSLGPDFDARFDAFARAAGPPALEDGLADGFWFAAGLAADDDPAITEDVRVELLLARAVARCPRRGGGPPVRRRGVFLAARRLPGAGRLLIVVRAPGLGRHHLSLPLRTRSDGPWEVGE